MARVRWRVFIDWAVTIGIARVGVFALEAEVAKPYRIPTSSMEPTLHCAKPGAWCEASGVVSNCTLSGNSAQFGGGAFLATMKNCIVYYNTAANANSSQSWLNCLFAVHNGSQP